MKEGRVLCQGSPKEVCQKTELLTETNLEEPAVLRLFRRLEKRGLIHETENVPRTWGELERLLE